MATADFDIRVDGYASDEESYLVFTPEGSILATRYSSPDPDVAYDRVEIGDTRSATVVAWRFHGRSLPMGASRDCGTLPNKSRVVNSC